MGLVDENNATATLYVILNVSGDLKEIGNTSVSEATGADNVSIILEDKKSTLKNYGKRLNFLSEAIDVDNKKVEFFMESIDK